MTIHIVESTNETARSGYMGPASEPVAVVAPGDIVPGCASTICGVCPREGTGTMRFALAVEP